MIYLLYIETKTYRTFFINNKYQNRGIGTANTVLAVTIKNHPVGIMFGTTHSSVTGDGYGYVICKCV